MSQVLDSATRREAFLRLVQLQDRGCTVSVSLDQVAADFQISVSLLRMIEQEGLEHEWPPLGGGVAQDEPGQTSEITASSHDGSSTAALPDPASELPWKGT